MNTAYYEGLSQALKHHDRAIPTVLIDLDLLDKNIDTLKSNIAPDTDYRIVVKSLPSPDLVDYVMSAAGTNKLMVFHQPFLTKIAETVEQNVDILIGKPMPVKTTKYFYNHLSKTSPHIDPYQDIQWLVDTDERIIQYINLAKSLGHVLNLNLEIDVGLHRGGFDDIEGLSSALQIIKENIDFVQLSGLMGYDPHIVKMPSWLRSQKKSLNFVNNFYNQCKDHIKHEFPSLWSHKLTFNGAGSPTMNLHMQDSPLNDISAGSCLLKPTTFDIPTLSAYLPACFIATPVLKKFENTTLPGLERIRGLLNMMSSSNKNSYFIYGGYWKADFSHPKGVKQNSIFGGSSNQTMINAPVDANLHPDDYVFLRPHQSESVLLQFGNILTIRNSKIEAIWRPFSN